MIRVIHPADIEFLIGEIGIIDSKYAPKKANMESGGEIVYWNVDDAVTTLEKLTAMGEKQ